MNVEREMQKRDLAAALQRAAQSKRCFVGAEDTIFYDFAEQLLRIHEAREGEARAKAGPAAENPVQEQAVNYRAVFLHQYRTIEPVPRPTDFYASNDDEAVGKALGMCTELDFRYGRRLHGVARLEGGKPTVIILENNQRMEKPVVEPAAG